MTPDTEHHQMLRQFLLGSLDAEGKGLEERLMLDDELYEELLIAEDELVDDYLGGRLTAAEARQFREHFLKSSQHRQDLEFAETLKNILTTPEGLDAAPEDKGGRDNPPWFHWLTNPFGFRSPQVGFALAALLAVLILGGVWLATRAPRPPELAQTPERPADNRPPPATDAPTPTDPPGGDNRTAGPPPQTPESRPDPPQESRGNNSRPASDNSRAGAPVFTVALALGALRDSGGLKKVSIPPRAATVSLRLALAPEADDVKSFRADLKTDAGVTLLSTETLRASGAKGARTASWAVPADLLKGGDYEVVLGGRTPEGDWETLGRYNFRVHGQ